MRSAEATVLYTGPDHCAAIFENVLIIVAQDDPRPSLVRLLPTFVRRLKSQAPGPIGFLVVVRADARPPAEDARATLRSAFRFMNESMSFGAIVVEMVGFVGASMRSVVNLLTLASRPTFPLKVFGALDEAARWVIHTQPPPAQLALAQLTGVVTRLRADYAAGSSRDTP